MTLAEENLPLKKCSKHGDLFFTDIIKSGKSKITGKQNYKCRKCMQIFHQEHYKKNKEKVLYAHRTYKDKNPKKYQEMKNKSKRKMYSLNPKKHMSRVLEYEKKNPDKKVKRQKKFKDKATQELSDVYVKQLIVRGTSLKHADIPLPMVETAKKIFKLKRIIKDFKEKESGKNNKHETIER